MERSTPRAVCWAALELVSRTRNRQTRVRSLPITSSSGRQRHSRDRADPQHADSSKDAMIREAQLVTLMGGRTRPDEVGNEWLFRFRPPDKYAGKRWSNSGRGFGTEQNRIIHDTDAFGSGALTWWRLRCRRRAWRRRAGSSTPRRQGLAAQSCREECRLRSASHLGTNSEDDAIICERSRI